MADSGCEDTVPSMAPTALKMPDESDASMRARLFTSLSQSFPHSQLYKALHGGEDLVLNNGDNSEDDDDSLYGDHLSNSCFASLRMERRDSDDLDDDLCSLEWLQREDLLKNIGGQKLDGDEEEGEEQKENEDVKPDLNLLQNGVSGGQQQPHFPYHPQRHVNSKPPYSFSCLIFMAVENSPKKMLPVKDIYNWILTQFPYFQNAPTGWKNSVRHNLSLNKCFKKVEKDKGQSIGKGSLWCIDPAYRPNLLQALRKTPYHPYHQLQMTSTQPQNYMQYQSLPGGRTVLPLSQRPVPNTVSPHLFPFLSRRLAQTSFDVDNEMKDVAQTLVALKGSMKKEPGDNSPGEDIGPTWKYHKRSYSYNNPRRRPSSPVIVTGHPYGDHAYSSTRLLDDDDAPSPSSSSSSIDEEYDFGDDDEGESDYQSDMDWDTDDKDEVDGDFPPGKKLKIDLDAGSQPGSSGKRKETTANDSDDDEQKKLHEGANALLNLAGLLLNNRSSNVGSSKDGGESSKKKPRSAEKKKKIVKKKKVKASTVKRVEQKPKEKVARKSFSKRKNAGSNAKYDSDEYSLTKPRKSSSSRSSSKSPSEKGTPKSASGKGKSAASSSSVTKIRKPSVAKRKLKLSKTFGAKKPSLVKTEGKHDSQLSKSVKLEKKKFSTKKQLKKDQNTPEVIKSPSETSDLDGKTTSAQAKTALTNGEVETSPDLTTADNQNNNNVSKALLEPEEKDKGLQEESASIKDLETTGQTNCEILTPAGDAPASGLTATGPEIPENVVLEDGLKGCGLEINSSAGDEEKGLMKKIALKVETPTKNAAMVAGSGANDSAHKSPHFTRFSKKKGTCS